MTSQAVSGRTAGERRTSGPWIAILLALVTAAVYARVVTLGFVDYDDHQYVIENEAVLGGVTLDGLRWVMTHAHGGNWHPLTGLSHMLDVELFGTNPVGHHVVNALLHVLNVVLLYAFLAGTTRRLWCAALVAALFALHPLRVESVAWVSERKDVLSGAFALATLCAWAAWYRRGGAGRYLLALLLFALGLAAKPMLVTLPFVLLLVDVWPLGRARGSWRLVLEKLPFFALAALSCLLTFRFQSGAGAVHSYAVTFPHRLENALISYVRYLGQAFWPADLCCFYPHPYGHAGEPWSLLGLVLGGLLLVALTALALRRHATAVGWLWYLGMLVPVIGLVQVGSQGLADRYTYLPLTGVFIALVYGGAGLLERRALPRGARIALTGVVLAVLAALALRTWVQIGTWRDSKSLFANAVAVAPSPITLCNLGNAYSAEGDPARAEELYLRAAEIAPDHTPAYFNLAVLLQEQGRLEESVRRYRETIACDPNYALAYRNLGLVLDQLDRLDEAVEAHRISLAIEPDDPEARYAMGVTRQRRGELELAVSEYEKALALRPDYAFAHLNLGSTLRALGRSDEAALEFERALELDPDNAIASYNLGVALMDLGRLDEAVRAYERAIALDPGYVKAHYNLGNLARSAGRLEQAVLHFEAARRLDPAFVPALENLLLTLAEAGRHEEALVLSRARIDAEPGSAQLHFQHARLLDGAGDPAEALRELARATALQPGWPEANALHAEILSASAGTLGQPAEALRLAEDAVRRSERKNPWMLGVLARAQHAAGASDDALRTLDEARGAGALVETLARELDLLSEGIRRGEATPPGKFYRMRP